MGFKSKSQKFKLSGLIFDCKEDYLIFKNLDKNIYETVKLVNDGKININDVFKDIKNITVKECYYDAIDELDGTFLNATSLLMYEGTRFENDYKIGCKFFDKIKVIEFDVSNESDDNSFEDESKPLCKTININN